jgi:endonuclease-8
VPEGDTIHRAAARLRSALEGATLTRFAAPRLLGDRPRAGSRIEGVEARGKHLLVHFDDGLTLRTHMRMTGSWHVYRTGERWRQPAHLARATLELDNGWLAVCFAAPVVETYHRAGAEPPPLAQLGPDLCLPEPDLEVATERLARLSEPDTQIADALLDQRIAAGIGNVYKSEVLWACAVDPFAPVASVDADTRRRLYAVAHKMLRANLGSGPRRTLHLSLSAQPAGLAVYGRRGQPCRRCGTPVRARPQGEQGRRTFWCPTCQPSAS